MRAHKVVANTAACVTLVGALLIGAGLPAEAHEYHVAASGKDTQEGSAASPLRTIQAAAEKAQPGDRVIVHAGIYRERVDPLNPFECAAGMDIPELRRRYPTQPLIP